MRVAIAGIRGRVGRLLVEAVTDAGAILAGGVTRTTTAEPRDPAGLLLVDTIAQIAESCDVVIDFTHPDLVPTHAAALAEAGVAWVLGTTGLSPDAQRAVERAAEHVPVVQAANFSPGVALVTGLARRMAAALPAGQYDAEIVEMHHRQKVDAPSGTALAMGQAVAEGRGVPLDVVRESGRDGLTGPRRTGAIGFSSLRGGQIVGEHALLFTSGGEQIVLTHRAFDRRVFADGAVRAALWSQGKAPGLYGMDHVLDLSMSS